MSFNLSSTLVVGLFLVSERFFGLEIDKLLSSKFPSSIPRGYLSITLKVFYESEVSEYYFKLLIKDHYVI